MNVDELKKRLRIPVVGAPMFLVSGQDLLLACCKSGVVGSMPADNARNAGDLEVMLQFIVDELGSFEQASGRKATPWAINLNVMNDSDARYCQNIELLSRFKPPIVITSFGQPGKVVAKVHQYGGLVFHDIASMRHAEKAIGAGVDGLILLTAGGGGHTGSANAFAFAPQVRRNWDGAILLSGSIGDGRGILAAEVLGADFAYIGTRFAATTESIASAEYKDLMVSQSMADVLTTDRLSGVAATFLRGSISRAGLDPDNLPPLKAPRTPNLPSNIKPWRNVWSAGHGVGRITDIPTTRELVDRLEREYRQAINNMVARRS